MKQNIYTILKITALMVVVLFAGACAYDGKVIDPNTGVELNAQQIKFEYDKFLMAKQQEVNGIESAIAELVAQRDTVIDHVDMRAEATELAIGQAVAEIEARNELGSAVASLGASYVVGVVPSTEPLIDAVLPYLFGGAGGALAATAGPATVRRLRRK